MLDELAVENLGIIRSARIEPGAGLVAVTGETGAGKTLLLGALRLLRGDPARADRIGPAEAEARVEGRFLIGGDEIVAARRVTSGRSRAYLDGSMVAAGALGDRLGPVIEIVAQHEQVKIAREGTLRELVDGLLDAPGRAGAATYRAAYQAFKELRDEMAALDGDERSLARELDLLRHQAAEISAAALEDGEEERLGGLLRRLRNASEIAAALESAHASLTEENGALDALRATLQETRIAAKLDPEFSALSGRVETAVTIADELAAEIRRGGEGIDLDHEALTLAETRAAVLADLKRKYGATVAEIRAFGEQAEQRARVIERTLQRAESISAELAAARTNAVELGRQLAGRRTAAAQRLANEARGSLTRLGFRDPVLEIAVDSVEPGPDGADSLSLRFASDSGLAPGPVSRVASGGELSRLVLAIRVAAGAARSPVVAFDEIDAGVGGTTALDVGRLLATLAAGGQVLVVTHLPQVAAFADRHFVVDRDGAAATVRPVDGPERLAEISRMLSGMEDSERGRLHAEELMELAARDR